jgi:hypothetical protein
MVDFLFAYVANTVQYPHPRRAKEPHLLVPSTRDAHNG